MSFDHLALLAADVDDFVAALATGPPDAPIAGCPSWTLADLGRHLGEVHRWAREAIIIGAVPQADPADAAPTELDELAPWVRAGADRLLTTLRDLDPDQPTWHPFPVEPKVAGLWRRRQAQEASVHRWDAQRAIGLSPTVEAGYAADGVDEYWTVMLPRLMQRPGLSAPSSTFGVVLADTGHRFVADGRSGTLVVDSDGRAGDAEISGAAVDVLLRLWGRPVPEGALTTSGDLAVAENWLALGGV